MAMWVFGYGSLLWNPGFTPAETRRCVLKGYNRSFCMLSIHHRGTVEEPGLVLALDQAESGQCTGVGFRVANDEQDVVLTMLRERELISSAYVEHEVTLGSENNDEIQALAYVIDPDHEQYCTLDLETQAQMIARSVGGRGPNPEYLFNTYEHLQQMQIKDDDMAWLVTRVRQIQIAA